MRRNKRSNRYRYRSGNNTNMSRRRIIYRRPRSKKTWLWVLLAAAGVATVVFWKKIKAHFHKDQNPDT